MTIKMRVYEVARDLGMDNKALVALLQSVGVTEAKNHMSAIAPEAVERVKRHLEKQKTPSVVEERIRPTVVKRRAAAKPEGSNPPASSPSAAPAPVSQAPVSRGEVSQQSRSAGATSSVVSRPAVPERTAPRPAAAAPAPEPVMPAPPSVSTPAAPAAPPASATAAAAPPAGSTNQAPVGARPAPEPVAPAASAKPDQTKPVQPQPIQGQRDEAQPVQPQPVQGQPVQAPPVQAQPAVQDAPRAPAAAPPTSVQAAPSLESPKASESGEALAPPTQKAPEAPRAAATPPAPAAPPQNAAARQKEPAVIESSPTPASPPAAPVLETPVANPPPAANAAPPEPMPVAPPQPPAPPPPAPPPPVVETRPAVSSPAPTAPARPSAPKTGIDVWGGRPGVPMPQVQRGPTPRRVQYDPKAAAMRGRPGQQPQGGMMGGRPPGRGGPMRPGQRGPHQGMQHNRGQGPRPGAPPATQERSAHKKIVRIEESISLQRLAGEMGVKATEVLMKLMRLGTTGVNINSTLDADTAKIVASEFGWEVEDVALSEAKQLERAQGVETEASSEERKPRPPVVTVMGHVDHGKTSLLDQIRKTTVASGEAGGITQHIGAYSVDTAHGPITFLDTPGHEAFTAMRARGAKATDVVILVVAADDGVMPQTREAINHAKAARVPIVVAVNKCDKPGADPERVKRQLSETGLVPEEWGGDTLFCNVSALTRMGVDSLLEQVALQTEVLELRANPNKPGTGLVIEAELDRGRGPVATILVTDGTLNRGDVILAGGAYGKVRAMHDSHGRQVTSAGPSMPVAVIGLSDVPSAGDPMHVVKDSKKAQEIAETRKTKEKRSLVPSTGARAMTLEDLHRALAETDQLELKLIIKADVQGSVEAVSEALTKLSTEKVKVSVVHAAAGAITEGDVNLAVAAGAIIIGFNVRPAGKAAALAQKENIQIRPYNIIYNVVDEVKAAMEGLLAPTLVEKNIGKAEVRQVFRVSKAGNVAGCMVIEGTIRRSGGVRLMRDGAQLWSGKLQSLKRFKDDVREVKEGFDCGIALDGYQEVKEGDIIEAYETEEVRQTL